jgi:hypothetical protein
MLRLILRAVGLFILVFLLAQAGFSESSAGKTDKGGRTHTFGVPNPAVKLAGAAAYVLPGIVLKKGKPVLSES